MYKEIKKLIKQFDSIVIFGHKLPDCDCYGSQVALKEILKNKYPNKKIYISGSGVPKFFDFISPMDKVSDDVIKNSLAIIVDSSDLGRIEDERVKYAKAFLKIDHHIDRDSYHEGPFFINEKASSVCDILTEFVMKNKIKISPKIANALYLGIITDCGSFQYASDYPKTYGHVKYLCENGAEPRKLNLILNMIEEKILKTKQYIFSYYEVTKNGVIYVKLNSKTLDKLNITEPTALTFVNEIGNIEGYNVWAFFVEDSNKQCKVEVRSNGPAIQQILASYAGGGGHMLAAGATFKTFNEKEINNLLDRLDKELKNWKSKK